MDFHNRPCAAQGLLSYRYRGRYGFIMIGATDTQDALREAARSHSGAVALECLEHWNGAQYEGVQA